MIRAVSRYLIVSLWLVFGLAGPALAQSVVPDVLGSAPAEETEPAPEEPASDPDTPSETTDADALPAERWIADPQAVDYAGWEEVAQRIEGLLLRDQARPFALERLRTEVSTWRMTFASLMQQNADRLSTVDSQIMALGPVPSDGATEATEVATRRAALEELRDLLASPGLLAAEAHARAAGLINEIEIQLRARQTADLLQRNPSPLLPVQWVAAFEAIRVGLGDAVSEVSAGMARLSGARDVTQRVVIGLGALAVAIGLFLRGPLIARNLLPRPEQGVARLVLDALRTVADAVFPLLGLMALTYGLTLLDVFGPRGQTVLETVPITGSVIILTIWLGRQFFPRGRRFGPLNLGKDVRIPARATALTLAWLTALWIPFDAFIRSGPEGESAVAVLVFPLIIAISVVLFRFARLLQTPPTVDAGPNISQGRTRRVIGRLAQLVALAAPVLAAFGYGAAAEGILFPTILTLGVFGVVVYFQSLAYAAHELLAGDSEDRPYALLPVGVGFALALISLPILALVWGAQRADLLEYWAQFTEGLSFGETRISPTDFAWFVAVFAIGYFLTQFIKNTLRVSVLPRTRMDRGAQNAIVAGFGYIGIFVASVVAITSAGIDLSNLAIVAGALSVGIGFGLQTIVSNFVSGIILLIERPVSEGDWIEVGDKMGYVRDISVRSTRIETFDQTDVIVPNADLISNQVTNWTRGNLVGRLILPVGVGYGSKVDEVMEILKDVAETHPMVVMNPPPGVLFINFGADALEFEIRAILRDVNFVLAVRSEMNQEIARRFDAAGIEIPFAQRDIWLRNPEVLGHPATKPDQPSDTVTAGPGYNWDSDSSGEDADGDTNTDADADGDTN